MTALQGLGSQERGLLFGLDRLGASEAGLEVLDEATRAVCAPAWQAWCDASPEEREAARRACAAEIAAPWPAGMEALHPSWIREALLREPADLVPALLAGLPESVIQGAALAQLAVDEAIDPERLLDLQRSAFGVLEPLCGQRGGPLAQELARLEADELLHTVMRWGAWALGRSLFGAEPAIRARALAAVGEPWAAEIAAASVRPLSEAERGRARVLASRAVGPEARTPEERLQAVGLAALYDALSHEGPESVWQVAGRLPAALGRTWLGW